MEPVNQAVGLDTVTVTLIGGLVITIIGVIVNGVIQILTALRVTNQIQTVAKDTEAIKGHVNSEKTASEGKQALLENENKLLREMLADKKMTASLLAQAAATPSAKEPKENG